MYYIQGDKRQDWEFQYRTENFLKMKIPLIKKEQFKLITQLIGSIAY